MSKNRICYIDCLKGFAILTVVIGHVLDGYINARLFPNQSDSMIAIYNVLYAFHMPLFFIISGYVFHAAYFMEGSIKPSLKLQIKNVAFVYLVFSVLFGLFKIVCGKFTNSVTDILRIDSFKNRSVL